MSLWLYTLGSVILVSLISLIGVLTATIKENRLKSILLFLVSFSAGGLLGDAFIHLIPEIAKDIGFGINASFGVLLGIFLFFVLEKIIQWRHCHVPTSRSHPHPFGYMNLVGDAFHNLTDGMIIAGSYMLGTQLGITTTIAVIMHEIPQEMGDFGVLLHAGFSRRKALLFNFASALTAVLGAVVTLVIGGSIKSIPNLVAPFTAGGFIYIACSDLIPEMHKDSMPKTSVIQLVSFILGIGIMYLFTFL